MASFQKRKSTDIDVEDTVGTGRGKRKKGKKEHIGPELLDSDSKS